MAISLLRMPFMSCAGSGIRSRPCQRIWPATMRPGGIGTSFNTDMAVTVLPQPDSPTTPTVSPRAIVRSTPSTACSIPSSVSKCVLRTRISRSVSPTPNFTSRAIPSHHLAGIECIAQSVSDKIYGQHGEKDRGPGEQRPMRSDIEVVLGVVEDPPPGWDIGRKAETKERQGRFGNDRGRYVDGAGNDYR